MERWRYIKSDMNRQFLIFEVTSNQIMKYHKYNNLWNDDKNVIKEKRNLFKRKETQTCLDGVD